MFKKFFFVLFILAIGLALALFGLERWSLIALNEPLDFESCVTASSDAPFDLPKGASLRNVPNLLEKHACISADKATLLGYALRWQMLRKPHLADIKAGEYQLQHNRSLLQLIAQMRRGDVVKYSITIVEGTRFKDLRRQLDALPTLTHTLTELSDSAVMEKLGEKNTHPEGWFAPDTYFFTKEDTDMQILQRALREQQKRLSALWEDKADSLPYSNAYEALIMASIIERETGVVAERQEIAGVFVRRLQLGMRLQTDPTVIYGMGENYEGRITRADLREATPYNTYVIHGLPPTPIALPSAAAIHAALNPAAGETLYFVAKGDGSHYFSKTYAEHSAAVRRYQLQRRLDYRSSPTGEPKQ